MESMHDEKYRPLYLLSKKIYVNLKTLKSMMATQQGGGDERDEAYRPLYMLAKSIYLDMQKLDRMKQTVNM